MVDLAIVIVSFNTKKLTLKCLESILKSKTKLNLEIIVVDNASSDGSVEAIKEQLPQVKLVQSNQNLGFAKGNNLALKKIKADYVMLLNSDTEVEEDSLDQLVRFAKVNNFAIASCKLINFDASFQHNSGYLPTVSPTVLWLSGLDDALSKFGIVLPSYHIVDENFYKGSKEVGWVGGAAMLIKQEVFEKVGFLDENFFMYGEDVEFCLRAKMSGFKVGWTDKVKIKHMGGASSKNPKFTQWKGEFTGLLYIYQKYYGTLASLGLKLMIYIFVIIRAIVFALIGKLNHAKIYLSIISQI